MAGTGTGEECGPAECADQEVAVCLSSKAPTPVAALPHTHEVDEGQHVLADWQVIVSVAAHVEQRHAHGEVDRAVGLAVGKEKRKLAARVILGGGGGWGVGWGWGGGAMSRAR
jgi:hypothetical protein